jgi:hypothetical protein
MSGPSNETDESPVEMVSEAIAITENTIPVKRQNILCISDLNLKKNRATTHNNIGIIPMRYTK